MKFTFSDSEQAAIRLGDPIAQDLESIFRAYRVLNERGRSALFRLLLDLIGKPSYLGTAPDNDRTDPRAMSRKTTEGRLGGDTPAAIRDEDHLEDSDY